MLTMPEWEIPTDLQERLDSDEGETWEDDRWTPILLTVMKGTSYQGREIPLAWQIEFQPGDKEFKAANKRLQKLGIDPDGYGWADVLNAAVSEHHPEIVDELHVGDSETDTYVAWVESEDTCRILIQITWSLIHGR